MQVVSGTLGLSTATVKLKYEEDGSEYVSCSVGSGPVDAALKAVDSIVKVHALSIVEFYSRIVHK